MTDQAGVDLPFRKGHGTENDFVLVPDHDGTRDLSPAQVRFLCDRHAGLGGDGVIRVVPTRLAAEPEVASLAGEAEWFMDYRNADGSAAEMCGNGTRVFVAHLLAEGLASGENVPIATRAGVKHVRVAGRDLYSVGLGAFRLVDGSRFAEKGFDALVRVPGVPAPLPGLRVDMGNPHVVAVLPEGVDLDGVDLTRPPEVDPPPEHGINVEIVAPVGARHVRMRVHERGVGETRSCGTGIGACAVALMMWSGDPQDNATWRVDVAGGSLDVRIGEDHEVELTGPAVLVADGTVRLPGGPA